MPKLNTDLTQSVFTINALGAIAAGIVIGFITAQTHASDTDLMLQTYVKFIALSVFSYLIGLLLVVKKERIWLRLPTWLWIAFLGSIVDFLIVHLVPDLQYIWKFRNSSIIGYASGAILGEVGRFSINVLTNTILTLFVLGLFRYAYRLVGNKVSLSKAATPNKS